METNYPNNLYAYYAGQPDKFELRTDRTKKMFNFALAAVCLALVIFPQIVPIGNLLVRIIAIVGLLYFGFSAFGGKDWYSKRSGGKIEELAVKKFETPERGTAPGGADDRKVMQMFADGDWRGLAEEPDCNDHPLQLYIHEDKEGKTFYLQLRRYFSSSDFRGVTEVKEIAEPQYSEVSHIIRSIRSTK